MANPIKSLAIAATLAFPASSLAQNISSTTGSTSSQFTSQLTCQSKDNNPGSVYVGDVPANVKCSPSENVVVIITEKKAVECNNTSANNTSCEQPQQTWTITIERDGQAAHDNQKNENTGSARVEGPSASGSDIIVARPRFDPCVNVVCSNSGANDGPH